MCGADGGQPDPDRGQGDHADCDDEPECAAPAQRLTQPGCDRDADDRGHREARHDVRDGPGTVSRAHQFCRHQCGDPEVGAMRETGDEPRRNQRPVARRHDGGEVAQREDGHQRHQQGLARNPRGECGDQGCPDHHAERVGGDHVAGGRLADVQARGDLGQQAHRDELIGADAEAAERQREDGEFQRRGVRGDHRHRLRAGGTNCCGGQEVLLSVCQVGTCFAAEHPIQSKASRTLSLVPFDFCPFWAKVTSVTAVAVRMLSLVQCKGAGHPGIVVETNSHRGRGVRPHP